MKIDDSIGITCDSRQVVKGDVFVAIPGFRTDGGEYAAAAVAKGAACVVATKRLRELPVPVKVVKNVRRYLGEEAARLCGNPSRRMKVYGITGTNGKTTTTWILSEFLGGTGNGKGSGLVTTVVTRTGKREFESEHTTPDAVALQKLFREMRDAKLPHCVMEVSSHAIALERCAGTRFAGGAFTNLSQDHLDFHKTMENYFRTKATFFKRLAQDHPGAPAAICVDGEYGPRMARVVRRLPLRLITCGFSDKADLRASDLKLSPNGCEFTLSYGKTKPLRLACPLTGAYNVQNVLTAAALALGAGVSYRRIVSLIPTLKPRWGRLERVESVSKGTVFVDFAHTDDALVNVLSTVRAFTPGKVWAVFGAGGDRDRTKRPKMGRAAASNADFLVVTSDNPRSERPRAIIDEILAGIPVGTSVKVQPDRAKAIAWAVRHAKAGDSVVVCGKGHERTQTIGNRILPFDDREVVRGIGGGR